MAASSSYSSTARHQAQDILSKPPFHTTPPHPPRPLAGVLHAIGHALVWALGPPARWLFHHVLAHIGHGFTGAFGGWWPLVLGALAIGLGVTVGLLLVRRRARIVATVAVGAPPPSGDDPEDLDRLAASAEDAGDHEAAVRLRFRAGVARLTGRGMADARARTDRQLALRLRSPTFDALSRRHEVIVYGRDRATSADADAARHGWPRVLAEVGPSPGTR